MHRPSSTEMGVSLAFHTYFGTIMIHSIMKVFDVGYDQDFASFLKSPVKTIQIGGKEQYKFIYK